MDHMTRTREILGQLIAYPTVSADSNLALIEQAVARGVARFQLGVAHGVGGGRQIVVALQCQINQRVELFVAKGRPPTVAIGGVCRRLGLAFGRVLPLRRQIERRLLVRRVGAACEQRCGTGGSDGCRMAARERAFFHGKHFH